jgi:hypothetical protein
MKVNGDKIALFLAAHGNVCSVRRFLALAQRLAITRLSKFALSVFDSSLARSGSMAECCTVNIGTLFSGASIVPDVFLCPLVSEVVPFIANRPKSYTEIPHKIVFFQIDDLM